MKSISASLVLFSGAIIFTGGGFTSGDHRDLSVYFGLGTIVVGLIGWGTTLFKEN